MVNTDAGLREALNFKGFKDETLVCQQLIAHQEQLYKLYIVGDKYDYAIKKSIPEAFVTQGDFFFFETKMKFNEEEFTKFNGESRLKYEELGVLVKALRDTFKLNLMGADLLIEENTGRIYIIDVNYFSSYMDLPNLHV